MPTNHTVKPGDCFNSIAKEHGFFNYRSVYTHGQNAKNWPNANTLEEGKTVEVPDKKQKKIPLKIDAQNNFVLDRRKTRLRVVLLDAELKPLNLKTCKTHLDIDYTKLPAKTGLLELTDIDPETTDATITVKIDVPPPPVGMPAPAPVDPKKYPMAIAPEDFADKNPDPEDQTQVEWTLNVGSLEAHGTCRGITHRLVNLGFHCAPVKVEDDDTKAAVNAYQLYIQTKAKGSETGKIADVRDDVKTRHDKL
jgi:hypothetical protein